MLVFTGFAAGVVLSAPIHGTIAPTGGIPIGKDHFDALPRVLAGVGSGIGAIVVFAGAVVVGGAVRAPARARERRARRRQRVDRARARSCCRAAASLQGIVGKDESVRDLARGRNLGDLRGLRRRVGRGIARAR